MTTKIYTKPRTLLKWDEGHIIGYLGEKIIEEYVPESIEGEEKPEPCTGYSYTGTQLDGGTIMECADPTSRNELVNAIIRSRYSQSEEMAIHRHVVDDAQTYAEEWQQYDSFCEEAKQIADHWLAR